MVRFGVPLSGLTQSSVFVFVFLSDPVVEMTPRVPFPFRPVVFVKV